jgi:ubiquinone/menaquinone biosynthesis C-methylase UbiE
MKIEVMMRPNRGRGLLARIVCPRRFPHQLSWLIDNPLRRLLITPIRFAGRLPLAADSIVLEIGPGSGYFSVELARQVPRGRLELLDRQSQMLAKARRKLLASGYRNVGYTAHDAAIPLPYDDESFDIAVLVAVLGEVSNMDSCLQELFRIIRPGGVLAVHEHVPDPDRIRFSDLKPLVEKYGFRFREHHGPSWNYTACFERRIRG